jgi:hypothetical protein
MPWTAMREARDGSTGLSPARLGWREAARRFWARSPYQRRLWLRAWWTLLSADLRLRLSPARALARALADSGGGGAADARAAEIAHAVASAAAHHLWPMRCLPRSLALSDLLRGLGVAARVRIGVRNHPGALAAHAWVEVAGVAVGEPEAIEDRFLPLVPGPANRP